MRYSVTYIKNGQLEIRLFSGRWGEKQARGFAKSLDNDKDLTDISVSIY